MGYFLFRQGVTYGPYSVEEMRAFLAEGRVLLTDFAKTEATAQWQPLHGIWEQPARLPVDFAAAVPPPPLPIVRAAPVPPPAIQFASPQTSAAPAVRLPSTYAPVPPPPVPRTAVATTRGNLLSWPFHQQSWFTSLWMILLWWFPVPLIPLGAILSIGWSIDAARRWSSKAADLLPRPGSIARMFQDGVIVVFFFCFYFLIPVTLGWMATSLTTVSFLIPAVTWAWHYLQGQQSVALADLLQGILFRFLIQRAAIVGYLLLAWPMFTAAAIRFVLTREAGSFFHLPACVGLLFRHFWSFVKFFILAGLAAVVVTVGDALLVSTGVGVPVIILVGAVGVWAMTYLFANLAARVLPSVQTGLEVRQQVSASAAGHAM